MVYITSIPIIKTQYIHSPIFRRRPVYTHQNGNINPTSCRFMHKLVSFQRRKQDSSTRKPASCKSQHKSAGPWLEWGVGAHHPRNGIKLRQGVIIREQGCKLLRAPLLNAMRAFYSLVNPLRKKSRVLNISCHRALPPFLKKWYPTGITFSP